MTATPPAATKLAWPTNEEFLALCERVRANDRTATTELFNTFRKVAVKWARKYTGYGMDFDDLFQEASLAILEAAREYQFVQISFVPWVVLRMRSRMTHHVRREASIVTIASNDQLIERGLKRDRSLSTPTHGGAINAAKRGMTILDEARPETWQDNLKDAEPNPEEQAIEREIADQRHEILEQAIRALSPREQYIIRQYTLKKTDNADGVRMEDIGTQMGITKQRVQQIELTALRKVREHFEELGLIYEDAS